LGELYTQGNTKSSGKSENAVADDRVLKLLYDADLRHVESLVRCHHHYHHHHHPRISSRCKSWNKTSGPEIQE